MEKIVARLYNFGGLEVTLYGVKQLDDNGTPIFDYILSVNKINRMLIRPEMGTIVIKGTRKSSTKFNIYTDMRYILDSTKFKLSMCNGLPTLTIDTAEDGSSTISYDDKFNYFNVSVGHNVIPNPHYESSVYYSDRNTNDTFYIYNHVIGKKYRTV